MIITLSSSAVTAADRRFTVAGVPFGVSGQKAKVQTQCNMAAAERDRKWVGPNRIWCNLEAPRYRAHTPVGYAFEGIVGDAEFQLGEQGQLQSFKFVPNDKANGSAVTAALSRLYGSPYKSSRVPDEEGRPQPSLIWVDSEQTVILANLVTGEFSIMEFKIAKLHLLANALTLEKPRPDGRR